MGRKKDDKLTINLDGNIWPPGSTSPSTKLHVVDSGGSGAVGVTPLRNKLKLRKKKTLGEILFGKERFGGRMKGVLHIKFKGKKYLLVGDLATGGAIATQKAYDNFKVSYAHLGKDGTVMRYREIIGTKDDIKVMRGKK